MSLLQRFSPCSQHRFTLIFFSAALMVAGTLTSTAQAQAWKATSIYQFCSAGGDSCTDGGDPAAGLIQGKDGNLYGLTSAEGSNSSGTAFMLTPAGKLTLLYSFCSQSGCADGSGPNASLILGSDGNFYGTTPGGGTSAYDAGIAFKMTPAGSVTPLYEFCGTGGSACTDGEYPNALLQGSDGNFYGTTNRGGAHGWGSVFQLTASGVLKTIYSFCPGGGNCSDGVEPIGNLVEGPDGAFYGVTGGAGSGSSGTAFRITAGGAYSVIYNFCSKTNCTDGASPDGGLALGSDGKLYGFTTLGGASTHCNGSGCGVIFALTTAGGESVIHSFCTGSNCSDGEYPAGTLLQASDGRFYGTTDFGGNFTSGCSSLGCGTVFSVDTGGSFSTPYAFCPQSGCPDGWAPVGGVIQAADGNLYGTTQNGGTGTNVCLDGCGTAFQLTPSSTLAASSAAPVQLTLNKSSVAAGSSVTLSWNVLNAFSLTMQQCYAFVQGDGAGNWTGKQSGKMSGNLFSGSASITPTTAGTYSYALTCGGIETGSVTLTVTPSTKTATSTTLAVAPNPLYVGQSAALTATVTRTGGSGTPTGSVTFVTQGITIGTAKLNNSAVATLSASTSGLVPGKYSVNAQYGGDSADDTSVSPAVAVTLKAVSSTATALVVSPTSVTPPGSVTLKATVSSSGGTPTGTVSFSANGSTLATVALNGSGVASLTSSSSGVSPGKYSVVATYNGAVAFKRSASAAINVTVK